MVSELSVEISFLNNAISPLYPPILKESLETRGFLVYHAPNGKVAYDYYLQRNPDILVLDVMMPIKDGLVS